LLEPALLERIKGLSLVARRVVEGVLHGLHRSPFHGLSIEFAQHRQYTPGDELKRLDWRVLARSDRYVLKQYEQETNMRVILLVDCSRSMAFDGEVVSFQPSLQPESEPDGSFSMHGCWRRGVPLPGQGQGSCSQPSVIEQLAPRAARATFEIRQLLDATPAGRRTCGHIACCRRLTRRCLVIVISDLLDQPRRARRLGQLTHRGHECSCCKSSTVRARLRPGAAGRGVTSHSRAHGNGRRFEAGP
jgi:hypothetical protein